ncbi:MAG: polysaccharide deacetylase family protein, partial [Gammaproteobacteria bacterium]
MKRLNCILFHDIYTNDPAESGFNGPGAEHYKLPVTEFERHLRGLQQVLDGPPVLITASGTDTITGQVPFAITVDDGGISYYTNVAARLEAMNWRGHCFVTTDRIGRPGFLTKQHIQELHARGHVIGSHSVSHPRRFS